MRVSSETGRTSECFINSFSTRIDFFPQSFQDVTQGLSARFPSAERHLVVDSRKIQVRSLSGLAMASKKTSRAKLYQFPLPFEVEGALDEDAGPPPQSGIPAASPAIFSHRADIVISGTFRKDQHGLKLAYEQLSDLGFRILSPTSVAIESEADGFVFMDGESRFSPEDIESAHLNAIQQAALIWLHAPDGYVGASGSLEVGFARAIGVPVYSQHVLADPILRSFVTVVPSLDRLIGLSEQDSISIARPPLKAFQKYYMRAAIRRGYGNEDAKDTLVLMLEELGELARAIRKRAGITKHGATAVTDEGLELADVFIYVVHLANILNVDLGKLVQQKELRNLRKFEKALSK
jgi:NTP pyrophosphatase (non-canonical NTP hydrolase)